MMKKGQLLITFYAHTKTASKNQIHTQLSGKKIDEIPQLHVEIIEVPVGEEAKYKALYEQHPDVRFVDYNAIRKLHCQPYKCTNCQCKQTLGCRTNDQYYLSELVTSEGLQNQWGLRQIKPERAFCEVKKINPTKKIAVLDTGIDPNHPDLAAKIIEPINFTSTDPEDYIDTNGHGTFVAGIAAAITDNQMGIASASYNTAQVIPVKVLGDNGGTTDSIIKGIAHAMEKGADVINMSLGGPVYTQIEQTALENAWKQGIILIAAAGNEGHEQSSYPAAYNFVLGVSATDKTNRLASFSNWGSYVGITAPGTEILSTTPTFPVPGYKIYYDAGPGTSFAAPFVSGVAAMLRAVKPTATNQEIIQAIQRSACSLDTEDKKWDSFYGYGLLNLSAAVQEIQYPQIPYCKYCNVLGSFYGQVVDSDGNAVQLPGVEVSAINNTTQVSVKKYLTKYSFVEGGGEKSDGMFRLFNLPAGNYSILGSYIDPITQEPKVTTFIDSINIIPGADVYLQLVLQVPLQK